MRWALVALCTVPFSTSALVAQEPEAAAQSAVAGAAVFGEHRCGVCHSVNGRGGTAGPDLRDRTAGRDVYGITTAVWNHLPDMARMMDSLSIPRPELSAREAGDLVAYLYVLGGAEVGSPERGASLYRDAGCVRCHRVGQVGGVVGPALDRRPSLHSPFGLAAGLWNHAGAMIPRMRELGIPYPKLTAQDIADLGAFLAEADSADRRLADADTWVLPGDAARGAELVEREECARCHRIAGRGAGTAPELAAPGSRRTVGDYLAGLWNKGPAMRAAFAARGMDPPTFAPGEIADLTAYLQSLGYFATSGNAARGADVIQTSGCLDCHGWGNAGATAPDLLAIGPMPEPAVRVAVLWSHLGVIDPGADPAIEWSTLDRSEMVDLLDFLGAGAR